MGGSAEARPALARLLAGGLGRLALLLALELVLFSCTGQNFASVANGLEIVRTSCELGLLALGTTLVLASGAIDLSVGSVMGLAAVTLGSLAGAGIPFALALALALAVGLTCGLLNGVVIARLGVPPLLATLATMALYRGLAEGHTGGYAVYTSFPAGFLFTGQGYLLGFLPPQVLWLGAALACAWVLAHRTAFGRRLAAMGYSAEGAEHAALPLVRDRLLVQALSGLAAAAAGVLYTAHVGQAKADVGSGYELSAITIAALGGTSVFGGSPSVPGTALALFSITTLQNGLLLSGLPSELGSILSGLLLIAAVSTAGGRGTASLLGRVPAADDDSLDMKTSQLCLLIGAILTGAGIIAWSNVWAVRQLARPERRTVAQEEPAGTRHDGPPGTRTTVAMMPKNKSDPYFVSCRKGAEEAAEELGVELIWDGPAETDAARQNDVVEAWITRGVDTIAVSVENAASISTVLRKARSRGLKVLTWDADAEPSARDFLVNQATPQGIGQALADEAGRILGGKGQLAIVTASLTAANQNAWMEHMRSRFAERWPDVEIAVVRPSDGLRDEALVETKNILRAYPDVKLIVTIAAAAVPGSAEAVKQEGSSVKVIGLSVPSLCRAYVHEGVIESIFLWNTIDLGYLTVYAAEALATGELDHYSTEIEAGRLGQVAIRDGEILLGAPFRFDATNIDRFEF